MQQKRPENLSQKKFINDFKLDRVKFFGINKNFNDCMKQLRLLSFNMTDLR